MSRLLWVLALAACGSSAAPPSAPTPAADPRLERIEHGLLPPVRVVGEDARLSLEAEMRKYRVPGVSIAVWEHGKIIFARGYGVADASTGARVGVETRFQAGSVSKSVNALAVLEAGFDLDAPINSLLTAWKLPDNELTRATPVTLRMLLSHTAGTTVHGFPGYAAGAPVPTLVQVLQGAPPASSPPVVVDAPPGAKYRYSGGGISITQLALVERTKQPYPQHLAQAVLAPLGMAHSTYEQPLPAALAPQAAAGYSADGTPVVGKYHTYPEMAAAGLWTTPSDLARFFGELQRARRGESNLVPKALAVAMTTAVAPDDEGGHIGLGVFLRDERGAKSFGHAGADEGFQTDVIASLDGDYGLALMANSDNGFRIFGEIERAISVELGWPGVEEPIRRAAVDVAPLAGLYAQELTRPFRLEVVGGKLIQSYPFGPSGELVPVAPDRFVSLIGGAPFRLEGGALVLDLPHGPSFTFTRVPDGTHIPLVEAAAGHLDAAIAAYREIAKTAPASQALDENMLNVTAYGALADTPAAALVLLQLNAAMHPDSANVHDSLGDGYAVTGDKARAIAEYEAALAALPRDTTTPPGLKAELQRDTAKKLEKLRRAK